MNKLSELKNKLSELKIKLVCYQVNYGNDFILIPIIKDEIKSLESSIQWLESE